MNRLRVPLGDTAAILHNINAIGDAQHLVQSVRHKNNRSNLAKSVDFREKSLQVIAFKNRCRLVQNNYRLASVLFLYREGLGDFYHLLLGKRERVDQSGRGDLGSNLVQLFLGPCVEAAPAIPACSEGLSLDS